MRTSTKHITTTLHSLLLATQTFFQLPDQPPGQAKQSEFRADTKPYGPLQGWMCSSELEL